MISADLRIYVAMNLCVAKIFHCTQVHVATIQIVAGLRHKLRSPGEFPGIVRYHNSEEGTSGILNQQLAIKNESVMQNNTYRITRFFRWEFIFTLFASDVESAKIVK